VNVSLEFSEPRERSKAPVLRRILLVEPAPQLKSEILKGPLGSQTPPTFRSMVISSSIGSRLCIDSSARENWARAPSEL
jgi:hypothetical protein